MGNALFVDVFVMIFALHAELVGFVIVSIVEEIVFVDFTPFASSWLLPTPLWLALNLHSA